MLSVGRIKLSQALYAAIAVFLTWLFLLGVATEFNLVPRPHRPIFGPHKKKPDYDFPDFNKFIHFSTLSEDDIGLNDPSRRLLIIGDVHGMNKSLHNLLSAVSYTPETDSIVFAGDVMAKSTLSGSLAIVDFISEHKCGSARGQVYAVRGNHDQMVVQWRAWRDWFEPLQLQLFVPHDYSQARPDPPVRTGREFLARIEAEWERDRKHDPKGSADPDGWADTARKRAAGTWRAEWWRRIPRAGKGRAKKDWGIFADHYWLAKTLTETQKECLYSLPLVLHVPSEHFFVVHAGVLPSDPKRPVTDEHQPLAHPPDLYSSPESGESVLPPSSSGVQRALSSVVDAEPLRRRNKTLEQLRTAQERAILLEIPDNRDPWVLLNMRGIRKKGKVTRNNSKGTPWSKVWNGQISRCAGFDNSSLAPSIPAHVHRRAVGSQNDDSDPETISLPCEPATVVYGHAATRGLDIKRWSVGIDTGCLYGRRLTALVLQRPSDSTDKPEGSEPEDDDDDDDDEEEGGTEDEFAPYHRLPRMADHTSHSRQTSSSRKSPKTRRIQFGDDDAGIKARLVSIKCPKVGDLS